MKKTLMTLVVVVSMSAGLIFSGCSEQKSDESSNDKQLIGGQRDEHGCLTPAGYQWCPSKQKCMRMWEEYCEEFKDQFKVENFDDCIEAGNPIMESDPRQCKTPDGQTFTEGE